MSLHAIVTGRRDWQAVQQRAANVDRAEAAYRDDPALAEDLEATGWGPTRRAAAWKGKAMRGNPDPERGAALAVTLTPEPGRVVFTPSMFAEFTSMRAQLAQEQAELTARIAVEVELACARRERELLGQVQDTRVSELAPILEELRLLLTTVTAIHPARGRTREQITVAELVAAATGAGRSLLAPLEPDQGPANFRGEQPGRRIIWGDVDPDAKRPEPPPAPPQRVRGLAVAVGAEPVPAARTLHQTPADQT
jgi:hypothetical protein